MKQNKLISEKVEQRVRNEQKIEDFFLYNEGSHSIKHIATLTKLTTGTVWRFLRKIGYKKNSKRGEKSGKIKLYYNGER